MQRRRKKNGDDDGTHPVQVFGQQRRRLYHRFGTSWNGRSSKRVLRQFAGSEKCFNSKWCTVVPSILMERDNDKVATAWSYWEEVAAEHQNKLVQVLPQLQRALPPDLCCVPLIKLPPWLFWSLPLCMTSHLKSKPARAHSSRHWPTRRIHTGTCCQWRDEQPVVRCYKL